MFGFTCLRGEDSQFRAQTAGGCHLGFSALVSFCILALRAYRDRETESERISSTTVRHGDAGPSGVLAWQGRSHHRAGARSPRLALAGGLHLQRWRYGINRTSHSLSAANSLEWVHVYPSVTILAFHVDADVHADVCSS